MEGDYLAVFGSQYSFPSSSTTYISIYDISSRTDPLLLRKFKLEGGYFNGRKMANGFIYILTIESIFKRESPAPFLFDGSQQVHSTLSQIFLYKGKYNQPVYVNIFAFDLREAAKGQYGFISLITEQAHEIYMS